MALTADDRLDIQNLFVRYAWLSDNKDEATEQGWLDLYTDDAVIQGPRGKHQGVQGVKEFAALSMKPAPGEQTRHLFTNILITGDGDRATVKLYSAQYKTFPSGGKESGIQSVSTLECKARKVNGTWKLQERIARSDQSRL